MSWRKRGGRKNRITHLFNGGMKKPTVNGKKTKGRVTVQNYKLNQWKY